MKLTAWIKALAGRGRDAASPAAPAPWSDTLMPSRLHEVEEDVSSEFAGLDFAAAIRAHQAWKGRLLAVVEGRSEEALDYQQVCRDDLCTLGLWLHGPGSRALGGEALLDTVRATHARFHLMAGAVLRAAQEGRTDEARALLGSDYQRASVQVQGKLAELFLRGSAPPA